MIAILELAVGILLFTHREEIVSELNNLALITVVPFVCILFL